MKRPAPAGSTDVLTKRLMAGLRYDPFRALDLRRRPNVDAVKPVRKYQDDGLRDTAYHLGRIRYFRDMLLRQGLKPAPIEVDNDWTRGGSITWEPAGICIIDGHHRLCGAILAGAERVRIMYSGRVDGLAWLAGERSRPPEWMGL